MEHDVEPTVWSQGVFSPSRTAMASLIDQVWTIAISGFLCLLPMM
ncbi:hypothetical protein [Bradyrhizobium ottawaense]